MNHKEELDKVQKERTHLQIEIALKSSEDSEQQRNIGRIKSKMRETFRLRQERERCCEAETQVSLTNTFRHSVNALHKVEMQKLESSEQTLHCK